MRSGRRPWFIPFVSLVRSRVYSLGRETAYSLFILRDTYPVRTAAATAVMIAQKTKADSGASEGMISSDAKFTIMAKIPMNVPTIPDCHDCTPGFEFPANIPTTVHSPTGSTTYNKNALNKKASRPVTSVSWSRGVVNHPATLPLCSSHTKLNSTNSSECPHALGRVRRQIH